MLKRMKPNIFANQAIPQINRWKNKILVDNANSAPVIKNITSIDKELYHYVIIISKKTSQLHFYHMF